MPRGSLYYKLRSHRQALVLRVLLQELLRAIDAVDGSHFSKMEVYISVSHSDPRLKKHLSYTLLQT